MIPHDGPLHGQTVRTPADLVALLLRSLGLRGPKLGFIPKPDLKGYRLADPIPARPPVVAFEVPARYRGRHADGRPRRVDPLAERRRLRAAS